MEVTTRIKYLTFILVGIIFLITGLALNELEILGRVSPNNIDEWYSFLETWIGTNDNGLPTPWEDQ